MSIDATKLQFYSGWPIDKIVASDSVPAVYIVAAASSALTTAYTVQSIANPYGQKCFTTMSYSIDATNFYDQNTPLFYYNSTVGSSVLKLQVSCACNASTIFFTFATNYTASSQTVTINWSLDTLT